MTEWARLAGATIFVLGTTSALAISAAGPRNNPVEALTYLVALLVAALSAFVAFRVRGRMLRSRQEDLERRHRVTWIADVYLNESDFTSLKGSGPVPAYVRSFALGWADGNLTFWRANDEEPAMVIPAKTILGAEAISDHVVVRLAPEHEADAADVLLRVLGSIGGMVPPSAKQLARVAEEIHPT
jgi:hypothetical protein